jgi:predicted RNase H-like nuclease
VALYIGLDGCRDGWVAVFLDGERRAMRVVPRLADVIAEPFTRLGIDMPIGLPETGERACDLAARAALRPHGARVFTGARRALWDHGSQADANAVLKARGEPMVSIQLWNIGPKIVEVDALVTPADEGRIIEVHPELVFRRLHGAPVPSKKEDDGVALRCALLRAAGFAEVDDWLTHGRRGTAAKPDDVLDACAVALAARDAVTALPAGEPPRDGRGLAMQIWF